MLFCILDDNTVFCGLGLFFMFLIVASEIGVGQVLVVNPKHDKFFSIHYYGKVLMKLG